LLLYLHTNMFVVPVEPITYPAKYMLPNESFAILMARKSFPLPLVEMTDPFVPKLKSGVPLAKYLNRAN